MQDFLPPVPALPVWLLNRKGVEKTASDWGYSASIHQLPHPDSISSHYKHSG